MIVNNYESYAFSGKSINCYGLEVVKKSISKFGHTVSDFSKHTKNTVLFSLYWPEQLFDYIKFRYNYSMKGRKIVVGGNTATANPSIISSFDSHVFLGDGENWDGQIESKYIISPGGIHTAKERSVSQFITPIIYEDVQDNRRSFCEMSRGCKNKCMFCQYGWLKEYRESDIKDIELVIKRSKTKSLRMFAADRFQHTKYSQIRKIMDSVGKCDTGSDVSMRFLLKNEGYLKYTNKIRCGLEGMSERIRSLVGKPFSDEDVVRFCGLVSSAGIKCLDFYMIYGLPTETLEDVLQFNELIKKIDSIMPHGFTIAFHWNAFTPSAQTPFQWASSSYYYNDEYLNKNVFMFAANKRIKLMHKPKLTGKDTILKRMLCIRASESTRNLLFAISNKKSILNNQKLIINEYEKLTGLSLCGEIGVEKKMPWDDYIMYDKEKMKKMYLMKLKNK